MTEPEPPAEPPTQPPTLSFKTLVSGNVYQFATVNGQITDEAKIMALNQLKDGDTKTIDDEILQFDKGVYKIENRSSGQ